MAQQIPSPEATPPQQTASTEPIRLAANEVHVESATNALANVTIEKQTIKTDRAVATTKTSVASSAWTPKKSTQSVAVSAVPSNNISQIELAATKTQSPTGVKNKLAVNSNNNLNLNLNSNITGGSNTNELATNINNNNNSNINNNINVKPIVPKVDDTPVTESTSTASDAVTLQSSEVQTIPVSDAPEAAPPVALVPPPAAAPPTNSWASLFNKNPSGSASSATDGHKMSTNGHKIAPKWPQNEQQTATNVDSTTKKPVAKVSPFNSTTNEQQSAKAFASAVPTPVVPTPIANTAGTLSYSAASTQKLPAPNTSSAKKEVPAKARVAPSAKATSSTEAQHIDESSYRIGGERANC